MIYTLPIRDPEKAYKDTWLWLPKSRISVDVVKQSLVIPLQKRDGVEYKYLWKDAPHHLGVPRERIDIATLDYPVVDLTPRSYEHVPFESGVELDKKRPERTTQRDAFTAFSNSPAGILNLGCGKGKTVLALHLIAQRKVPALIINDQTHILKQWVLRILEHMEVPGGMDGVGWIQGHPDKWTWKRPIVLASLTSLAKYASVVPPGFSRRYGVIIWDEIHHLPAASYCETADLFYGNRYGLTATTARADGGEALYFWHVGGVIHKDLEQDIVPEVVFIRSPTTIDTNDPATWEAITAKTGEIHLGKLAIHLGTLEQELNFNRQIVDGGMKKNKITLYAATSKDHSRRLHEMYPSSGVLDGDVPQDDRLEVLETHKTVFSTTKMAKEALDKETLDSLVILTEFSSENMLQQTVGRIQRFLRNKKSARVVVVWHVNIPPMAAMGNKLMGHFKRWGMKVKVI